MLEREQWDLGEAYELTYGKAGARISRRLKYDEMLSIYIPEFILFI